MLDPRQVVVRGEGAPPNPNYYPSYAPPAGPPPGRQNTDAFMPPYPPVPRRGRQRGQATWPPGYFRGDDYNGPRYDSTEKSLEQHEEQQGYGWANGSGGERDVPSERDLTSPRNNNAKPFL